MEHIAYCDKKAKEFSWSEDGKITIENEEFVAYRLFYNTTENMTCLYDIRKNVYYLNRKMPRKHIKFFQQLKRYYETDDYVFVHAGIFPGISLEESSDDILLWCRQFSSIPYEGKPVIYGHSPNSVILNEKYKICIDTGACFESMGDLTCVQLPERYFYRQGDINIDRNDN